jgi:hypothetical protein
MTNEEQIALLKKNPISVGCGVLSILLGVLIYFRGDAIPTVEADLTQKSASAERLAQNLKYSAQLKEQLDALQAAAKTIDSRIIRASQVGINTQYFYQLESDTGVKLVDFRPQGSAAPAKGAKSTYFPVAFIVSVQGTLPQVLDFIRQLEGGARYGRIVTASVSTVPANRGGPLTLSVVVELLGLP